MNLMTLVDEVRSFLKRESSFEGKGWKIVEDEVTLSNLPVTAAAAGIFPAGSIPLGCQVRNTVAVTTSGATNTYDVGITGGDLDAFGAAIAGALGTTTDETDFTVSPITLWSAAAMGVTLTPPGVEAFAAGEVKIKAVYLQLKAPAA